ncbi:MAG: DUF2442 domain-containing protein [Chloroflexi bacterium]|nr:DUF2442 domain-containing protein [Chloroflexota bacterium]
MMLIRSVKPLEQFNVWLEFSNGEQKTINLEPLMRGPIFEPLRQNPQLFRAVHINAELGTIVWDNGADIDPDVLYGSHLPAWMELVKIAA